MDKTVLKAEKRELMGRKVKALRRQGLIPANVYGKKVESTALQVAERDFGAAYKKAGETGLIELMVGKSTRPVLVHNVQLHPVSDAPLHVDFLQVDLKVKVTTNIPVEIEGESPLAKSGAGTVVQQLSEIEVEALPGDLIEKFVVDATKLTEVDQAVKVSDLKYDKTKIEVKTDGEAIVVKVEPPQKEEVVQAPVVAEVPTEGSTSAEATVDKEVKPEEKPQEAPKEEKPKTEEKK